LAERKLRFGDLGAINESNEQAEPAALTKFALLTNDLRDKADLRHSRSTHNTLEQAVKDCRPTLNCASKHEGRWNNSRWACVLAHVQSHLEQERI